MYTVFVAVTAICLYGVCPYPCYLLQTVVLFYVSKKCAFICKYVCVAFYFTVACLLYALKTLLPPFFSVNFCRYFEFIVNTWDAVCQIISVKIKINFLFFKSRTVTVALPLYTLSCQAVYVLQKFMVFFCSCFY